MKQIKQIKTNIFRDNTFATIVESTTITHCMCPSVTWDLFFILLFTRGKNYSHKYMVLNTVTLLNPKDLTE